jgi:hypothetical protein
VARGAWESPLDPLHALGSGDGDGGGGGVEDGGGAGSAGAGEDGGASGAPRRIDIIYAKVLLPSTREYTKLGDQRLLKVLQALSPPANGKGAAVVNHGLHLHSVAEFHEHVAP